jgi:FkbM family methyltransferase
VILGRWLERLWRRYLTPLVMRQSFSRHLWLQFRRAVKLIDISKVRFSIKGKHDGLRGLFVFNPADFPIGIRYHILARGAIFSQVLSYLRAIVPDSEFCGFVREEAVPGIQDDYIVITSEDWFDLLNDSQVGFRVDRIIVFIPLVGNPWGYWDATCGAADHFQTLANGDIHLPGDCIRRCLFKCEPHGIWRDKLVVRRDDYLEYHSALIQPHLHLIHKVADGLSDERSRNLYHLLFSADPQTMFRRYWPIAFSKVQYGDYVKLSAGDTVIDGGIHSGFEIPFFMAMLQDKGQLWCIDPTGFEFLHPMVRRTMESFASQIQVVPVALWNNEGSLRLPMNPDGQAIGDLVGQPGNGLTIRSFPCRQLDDIVSEYSIKAVDYIKLDLEGAEPQALMGMARTIEKFRPSLAVSIYHEPNHMWEIPLYLMGRLQDYEYYVGHYSYQRWESILYAIPSKR